MDPQKLSQLDPKLRAAYERVMGTTIPQPQAKSDSTQATPDQTQAPALVVPAPTTSPNPIPQPQPSINVQPQAIPTPEPTSAQPTTNFVQMNSQIPSAPAQAAVNPNFATPIQTQPIAIKRKGGMMPILFGFVGLIFIVIYTLFWTKVFNFKLPFLP